MRDNTTQGLTGTRPERADSAGILKSRNPQTHCMEVVHFPIKIGFARTDWSTDHFGPRESCTVCPESNCTLSEAMQSSSELRQRFECGMLRVLLVYQNTGVTAWCPTIGQVNKKQNCLQPLLQFNIYILNNTASFASYLSDHHTTQQKLSRSSAKNITYFVFLTFSSRR